MAPAAHLVSHFQVPSKPFMKSSNSLAGFGGPAGAAAGGGAAPPAGGADPGCGACARATPPTNNTATLRHWILSMCSTPFGAQRNPDRRGSRPGDPGLRRSAPGRDLAAAVQDRQALLDRRQEAGAIGDRRLADGRQLGGIDEGPVLGDARSAGAGRWTARWCPRSRSGPSAGPGAPARMPGAKRVQVVVAGGQAVAVLDDDGVARAGLAAALDHLAPRPRPRSACRRARRSRRPGGPWSGGGWGGSACGRTSS